MKKIFLILSSAILSFVLIAQDKTHVVRRGDSFESIAREYSVYESDLREANRLNTKLYVGSKVIITEAIQRKYRDGENQKSYDLFMNKGADAYKGQQYKLAAEYFQRALNYKNTAEAYYNTSLSYYQRGKYQESISYGNKCISYSGSNKQLADEARAVISNCRRKLEEKDEVGRAIAVGILGAAAIAGSVAAGVAASNNGYNTMAGSSHVHSTPYPNFSQLSPIGIPPMPVPSTSVAVPQVSFDFSSMPANVNSPIDFNAANFGSVNTSSFDASSSSTHSTHSTHSTSSVKQSSSQPERYECACFHTATFGQDFYHACPNCGVTHKFGTLHTCIKK